jgi:phosphatidylglycerophosphate synthase
VTGLRLIATLGIGSSYPFVSDEQIAVVALALILLDGVDGYLARKWESSSRWGAYFDMETDAFFVCLISSIHYLRGDLGLWILPIGYMRYLSVVGLRWMGRGAGREESRWAQIIAGVLFASLITPFVFDNEIYLPCVVVASSLVIISFTASWIRSFRDGR